MTVSPIRTEHPPGRRSMRGVQLAFAAALAALTVAATADAAPRQIDLSRYERIGRYDLPEPTRTAAPAGSLLAQEASSVTYNWDTDSLFVVGDGGTSVVQVDKTGRLIDSMTLAAGDSPQGTSFYDTEGILYLGSGRFALVEERNRRLVRFRYVADTTLTRDDVESVTLGTTIGNVGLEGATNDPISGGIIAVKEKDPRGIFQTGIDWTSGTATNGSPTAEGSTDLFDPSGLGLSDLSDVFALANVRGLDGPLREHLLVISQESGRIVDVDRSGVVASRLDLVADADQPLSIPEQTHEGVTMDDDGVLYTVNEAGGGSADRPQLWVFAPSDAPNRAPTGVSLANARTSIPENSSTQSRVKLADVRIVDDGIGNNDLDVTGPDAEHFEVDGHGLYLKAGTSLDHAAKGSYRVIVEVDDRTIGGSPDAASDAFVLTISPVTAARVGTAVVVSEVSPWSSGDSPYGADWFEVTNSGVSTIDLTGWKIDDSSNSFAVAVDLHGVTTLAPGESAVLVEGDATTAAAFVEHWFGDDAPSGFRIGHYTGSGIGLSTGGDELNLFDAVGTRITGVRFGPSTTGRTFDNSAGVGSTAQPPAPISILSEDGVGGATTVGGETGSPGVAAVPTPVVVTEVAPWGSTSPQYGADWWELTNTTAESIDLSGWSIDDDSGSAANAVALHGVTSLAPGQSAVFVEGGPAQAAAFTEAWFGTAVPPGLQVGTYSGSGVGLGGSGDAVNVFNAEGHRVTGVRFGAATTNVSFDNAARVGSFTLPLPEISTLSVEGISGAFRAHDEIGSPGRISQRLGGPLTADRPAFPEQPAGTVGPGQWISLANPGDLPVTIARVRVVEDDDASAGAFLVAADRCTGEALAPGATCRVLVRFAPGRGDATSSGHLVIDSDAAGDALRIPLVGTSVAPPSGPRGPEGPSGTDGRDGTDGVPGPRGLLGLPGPIGPHGPAGPQGATGPRGSSGTIRLTAPRSRVTAKRGRSLTLRVRVTNRSALNVGRLKVTAALPRSLRVRGTRSGTVSRLQAGASRTVRVTLRLARSAKLGTHTVKLRLRIGGRSVARTVTVRVTR